MLSTTLYEAAVEFGLALRQTPAVAAYRAATEAIDGDPGAQALLADLRAQQDGLARLQRSGLAPGPEQIDRLRLCQAAVRSDQVIMAHLQAANEVKAYLPTVAGGISAALGTDYARFATRSGC